MRAKKAKRLRRVARDELAAQGKTGSGYEVITVHRSPTCMYRKNLERRALVLKLVMSGNYTTDVAERVIPSVRPIAQILQTTGVRRRYQQLKRAG